jgi:hypothetical protein
MFRFLLSPLVAMLIAARRISADVGRSTRSDDQTGE